MNYANLMKMLFEATAYSLEREADRINDGNPFTVYLTEPGSLSRAVELRARAAVLRRSAMRIIV
jgi:hypothetical protein